MKHLALYSTLEVKGPAEIDDNVLAAVLTYHVAPGRVFSTDLSDGLMPETIQTGTITIDVDGGVTVTDLDPDFEDPNVTSTDILDTNGGSSKQEF